MENIGRREFIKTLPIFVGLSLPKKVEAAPSKGVRVELPELPFQETIITGEKKGGRLLIVGGIHGNEPGAYKAAEILRQIKVKRGELLIVPRSNFLSILANVRGYNGDMNRKFAGISRKDPDYNRVKRLKELIEDFKPDAVLSLHDGFGFHIINPKFWGQCIVIDEEDYKGYPLGEIAKKVASAVNKRITEKKWKIPVFNTKTFSPDTKHPEQRKSLTYFCLSKCKTPAFCLEVSKQLPDLNKKVLFHLMMIEEFFKIYGIKTHPELKLLFPEIGNLIAKNKVYTAKLRVNNHELEVSSSRTFKLKRGSRFHALSVNGGSGANIITKDLNMNLRRFTVRRRILLEVKDDFESIFHLRLIVV